MTRCVKIVNLHQPDDMSEFGLFTIIYARIMYMGCGRGRNVDRVPMYMGWGWGRMFMGNKVECCWGRIFMGKKVGCGWGRMFMLNKVGVWMGTYVHRK